MDDTQREIMRSIANAGAKQVWSLPAESLRQLVNRDILEPMNGDCRFRVELVRWWVQRQVA